MNVAIFGTEQVSQFVAQVIEDGYNPWLKTMVAEPINVVAYVSVNIKSLMLGDKVVLSLEQLAALYHKGLIDKIVYPRELCLSRVPKMIHLHELGVKVEDIYITSRLTKETSPAMQDFIKPYTLTKYLPYLEFHIADHCNLNCKACSHYSGLVKEPHFTNLEQFTRDFERLHEFIDDIGKIRILGGEPLLNPEVNEYIKLSRRLYPLAVIRVVTNAILLPKMPESFFETLRKFNAGIDISFYPPLESKMPEIRRLLEEKRVSFNVSPLIKSFKVRLVTKPHNQPRDVFLKCPNTNCNTLYKGAIAVCSRCFPAKAFNDYHGKILPEDGALDLYNASLTTEKLKAHLLKPIELCRYCKTPIDVEWTTIKHPSPLSDWVQD